MSQDEDRPSTPSTPRTPKTEEDSDSEEQVIVESVIPKTSTEAPKDKQQWPVDPAELLKALKRTTRDYKAMQKQHLTLNKQQQRFQDKCAKLKLKIKDLESKPHRRRSPNLAKIKRQETAWMAACKEVAKSKGVKYLVPQKGTDVYNLVREKQAQLQTDEPERFKRKASSKTTKKQKPDQAKSDGDKPKKQKKAETQEVVA